MTLASETAWLDATALADLVRRKEVTPAELVDAAIARIERLNPRLNAVITPLYEQARAAAAQPPPADAPFAGVPFLLKDLVAHLASAPQSEGSRYFKGRFTAPHDSELVVRHKRAGLIVLGKTNTPEFGLVPTTEPLAWGATHNPWDLARTPAGSSGGSAAAVAAGLVPMAHANDGGGSIRAPAAVCGLFGLKPTRGRNSLGPDLGDVANGLACEHAVTRSVRDSAALLDATAGPAPGEPYWASPPARAYAREVGAPPGRLRIALSERPLVDLPVHADCVAAVRAAAKLCEELGHSVEPAGPPVDGSQLVRRFGHVWGGLLGWTIASAERALGRPPGGDDLEPRTWRMLESARKRSAADYLLGVQDLQRMARTIGEWMEGYDVWLTPTTCQPPLPLGYFDWTPDDPARHARRLGDYTAFTLPCNVTGQPAMSVPLHWNAEGLPVGTQFIGRYGDEATLFRLAGQLEQARPWAGRRPPVSA
jgi:amidase